MDALKQNVREIAIGREQSGQRLDVSNNERSFNLPQACAGT